MEVIHERCAGLDVHKETVVGCVRVSEGGEVRREVRRFATTTAGLLELADWLRQAGCTHVAMEASGVYWKPVWHILEGEFELVLANPAHIRNVPGRKSDVNDATWIADLLAHGLIRASMVPPGPIQELRDLTRTRKQLIREVVQHKQRIEKVLEDANLKLASVVSDVFGQSGRRMLQALIAGQTDAKKLAALGSERLSASRETLAQALHGKVTTHHRFMLKQHLQTIEHLEQTVSEFEAQIEAALEPFRAAVERLMTIPGVSATAAHVIIAEIGVDMSRFATVGHLRSWAGLCPQLNESAGKVKSRRLRYGAPWLKTVLVQCAWAATRSKTNYPHAQFLRLRARRGPKKAILAVAASILTAAYYVLRDQVPYRDPGPL
ncbi:MAG: IS110 family transposase, partial [Deltaproteobacteria bacterium]|nr:IS110 family transposase [Deltaproteobacteria bacterium]